MKLHLLHPPQQQEKPTHNKRSFVFSLLKTRLSIRFSHHNRDDENYIFISTWLSLLVLATVIEIQMLQFVLLNIKWVSWVRETTRKKGSNTNIPAVTLYSCKLCGEMVLATSKVIF